jgi:peptidoglycan/xylan/chitin deacetylase (PgdA/CDA1 family)
VELQRGVGQVANHTYSHVNLTTVSQARRIQELQATARVLDYPNALFRPPFGETDPAVDADVHRSGLVPVDWTVDTGDRRLAAQSIVERALIVEPGGIIRLHEDVNATVAALPEIVAGLRRRGLCPGFLSAAGAGGGGRVSVAVVKP